MLKSSSLGHRFDFLLVFSRTHEIATIVTLSMGWHASAVGERTECSDEGVCREIIAKL